MPVRPDFRRGSEAAAEAAKGTPFARTDYLKIEDGKNVVVRFLTDANPNDQGEGGWITVDQHQMIPTKPQPEGYDGKWPEKMGAVCRYDPAFNGFYSDCYICDHLVDGNKIKRPSARVWALACLREEVIGDGSPDLGGAEYKGKLVGIRDMTREVTIPAKPAKDGQPAREEKKVTEKAVVVVNMGQRNFFSILQGFASKYGTLLDRDYWIQRSGAALDTSYQIVPHDPIEVNGKRLDLRDPEFADRYQTDLVLDDIVGDLATDEFYAKFFDPTKAVDKDGKIIETGAPAEQQAKPEGDMDPEKMSAIAERVKGYGGTEGTETEGNGSSESPTEAPAASGGMRDLG